MTFGALILLLVVNGLGPGLWLFRKVRWQPLEKLGAAIASSFLALYFVGWIGALTGFLPLVSATWSLVAAVLTFSVRREIVGLWREKSVRVALASWLGLLVWILLLQGLIRHYGGADWSGDWYEHYQRAVYFTLWPFDLSFLFLEQYLLPARPPLMNVVVADLMAQVGTQFSVFQVVNTALSSLVFLPVLVMAGFFKEGERRTPWVLAIFFALSPLFCQNATYTWTRLFTAFFVVLGVVLYLNAWRLHDQKRMVAAFAALAAGLLTHYSAGPYLVILAVHYISTLWRNRAHRWQEIIRIFVTGSVILASWFLWSLAVFGPEKTVGSNTTVTESEKLTFSQNVIKVGLNLERTLVPFPFHRSLPEDQQRFAAGVWLRDTSFLLYQNNFIIAIGSFNCLVVLLLVMRGFSKGGAERSRYRSFWVFFICGVVFLGVAVHGGLTEWGLAHICLQPMVLMALGLVAANYTRLGRPLKVLILTGLTVDFVLGIVLHVRLLQSNIEPGMGTITTFNWLIKQRVGLVFLADLVAPWATILLSVCIVAGVASILGLGIFGWRPPEKS